MSNQLKNLKELENAHKKFLKLSTDDIRKSHERVGFKFFQQLQVGTPRDESRAINGWIVSLDTTSPTEWKPAKGLASYKPLDFPLGKVQFNSMIWISNNVEYIQALDDGHSKLQAPFGFTNQALSKTTAYILSETNKLNRKKYNV